METKPPVPASSAHQPRAGHFYIYLISQVLVKESWRTRTGGVSICCWNPCARGQRQPRVFLPYGEGHSPSCTTWCLMDFTEKCHPHRISEITQLTTNEQPAPGDDQDWDIRIWLKVLCFHPERPRFRGVNVHPRSTRLQREVAALLEASKCFYLY